MTPKFITPCYVRVEDTDKSKEVRDKLEEIGYKNTTRPWSKNIKTIFAYQYPMEGFDTPCYLQADALDLVDSDGSALKGKFIDCGTNTELFLALAGMRSDTDKGQCFVYADDVKFKCLSDNAENYLRKEVLSLGAGEDLLPFRRATAQEIIEHFSQPTV